MEEMSMGRKTNLKAEKAKRNLEYALQFKQGSRPNYRPENDAPAFSRANAHEAVCSACGCNTTVPFKPSPGRSVLCRDCFVRGGLRTAG
jgi:CxxC-x17-CxxC domain-containing protein